MKSQHLGTYMRVCIRKNLPVKPRDTRIQEYSRELLDYTIPVRVRALDVGIAQVCAVFMITNTPIAQKAVINMVSTLVEVGHHNVPFLQHKLLVRLLRLLNVCLEPGRVEVACSVHMNRNNVEISTLEVGSLHGLVKPRLAAGGYKNLREREFYKEHANNGEKQSL